MKVVGDRTRSCEPYLAGTCTGPSVGQLNHVVKPNLYNIIKLPFGDGSFLGYCINCVLFLSSFNNRGPIRVAVPVLFGLFWGSSKSIAKMLIGKSS